MKLQKKIKLASTPTSNKPHYANCRVVVNNSPAITIPIDGKVCHFILRKNGVIYGSYAHCKKRGIEKNPS